MTLELMSLDNRICGGLAPALRTVCNCQKRLLPISSTFEKGGYRGIVMLPAYKAGHTGN